MVPKKAEGVLLRTTYSPAAGASWGTMALLGLSSFRVSMPGTFRQKMLWSASSSENTMRLCATGQPRSRAWASSCCVCAMASGMLPPPKTAGSAKPLTKSMMSRPKGAFSGSGVPKPWRA